MNSWQTLASKLANWVRQRPALAGSSVLFAIVVLVAAWFLNSTMSKPQPISLFGTRKLSADEIGMMQVAFGKSGLNEYDISGAQILVPQIRRADYLKSLADHNAIPQDLVGQAESSGQFEFFQSRQQLRARQIEKKKQTIRDMVMQLRFVDRAIVEYDESKGATPFDPMERTAIVNISPSRNQALTISEVKAIRDTVRGAVAGLSATEITIIDTFASRSHSGELDDEAESWQPHTVSKLQAERKYEAKIRSALTAYPGIRVNVEVGIDPVVRRIRDERNIESTPVVVERVLQRETSTRAPSTSPSLFRSVFGEGANSQARVSPLTNPYQRSVETSQSMANGSFETTEMAGPFINGVSVSIGIPERCVQYFVERNLRGQEADIDMLREQQEIAFNQLKADISQKVEPLIPRPANPAGNQQIVITLDPEIVMNSNEQPQTSSTQDVITVLRQNWLWLLMLGGTAIMMLLLPNRRQRTTHHKNDNPLTSPSTIQATAEANMAEPANVSAIQLSQPELALSTATNGDQSQPNLHRRSVDQQSPSAEDGIRWQLDQWCQQNPDTATNAIRQWLERKAG